VLVARDQAALDAAAARLARPGLRVLAIAADTTDDRAVRAMVARTVTELGGADILVNAAAQPGGAGRAPRAAWPRWPMTTCGPRSRPRCSVTCAAPAPWPRT
jgi:NAD(P)-dependent dehydrogenase (short-subunit alcohol dehydrogenase family)